MAVEWLTFHVTDRCQLDCHHCLRDPAQKPKDLEVELIRRTLAEGKARYGANHAAFSGGEPTLHPQFSSIVDAAVDLGFTWHMVSNGRKFADVVAMLDARPARRAGLTSVTFSLDGATEATHDHIREEGSYREVMAAIATCVAHGIKFVLQMSVHAGNEAEIEAMGLLASQLGAARLSVVMTQPTGTHHDEAHYLSPRRWRAVHDRLERLMHALTMPITVPEGFYREQAFHVCQPFASQQIHVNVEGKVNLCCQHSGIPSEGKNQEIAGDLHTQSLTEVHAALVGIIHRTQADKIGEIARGEVGEWDHFPCNWCMKHFGKPHWTDEGVGGPAAARQRWTGAWATRNHRLPIVR